MMKIFKNKNFKALIYSIFLSLPILTILGRSIYTIANKNAKDSYYGETINESETIFTNDLIKGNEYLANFIQVQTYDNTIIRCESITNINASFNISDLPSDIDGFNYILASDEQSILLRFYQNNSNNFITQYGIGNTNIIQNYTITFNFIPIADYTMNYDIYSYVQYNKYSYLDNAFEYSIDKFTQDNNFGKLNFFQWFSDLFLNNNQTNNLYIHFVNWYMNYILYVSLAYLLFAVLMWFVNFFRSLVEKNMDLDL